VTDPMSEELTEDELLLLWRALSRESRERVTALLLDEARRPRRLTMQRGPLPMAHAKARWITQQFDAYRKTRGRGGSVKELWPRFVATLPDDLRRLLPKVTAKSRGKPATTKTVSNLLTRGRNLNRQRPELRRLVAVLRASGRLSLAGNPDRNTVRAAIEAARAGRSKDLAEIKRLADEYEFWRDSATRALIGDEAVDAQSFVRLPPRR
jgi:hypothetical protein